MIKETSSKKHYISKFIGAWNDVDEKEARKLHKFVEKIRRRAGKQRNESY